MEQARGDEDERLSASQLEALRSALIAGEESGFFRGDPFKEVLQRLRRLSRPTETGSDLQ